MDKYNELDFTKLVARVIKTQIYGVEYVTLKTDEPPFKIFIKMKDNTNEFCISLSKVAT